MTAAISPSQLSILSSLSKIKLEEFDANEPSLDEGVKTFKIYHNNEEIGVGDLYLQLDSYLKNKEVGCRDTYTQKRLSKYGIRTGRIFSNVITGIENPEDIVPVSAE